MTDEFDRLLSRGATRVVLGFEGIQVYVDDHLIPNHAEGIYTIAEAKDQAPLAVKGVVVTREQYDSLLAHCDGQNATWPPP